MEAFGIYSLKAGIILALFWGIYRLFLHRETFYRFNRFFLLSGLIASLLLPLYTIHYTVEVKAPDIPIHLISESGSIASFAESAETVTDDFSIMKYFITSLPFIYASVLCLILIVRFVGFSRLLRIIHHSKHKKYSNYILIESPEFNGAFSFFSFIFLPENLSEFEKSIIVRHEEAHIAQNHWIDLLITNILSLMWWFNPIIHLYEKVIKNNHEYLADKEVLSQCGQAVYQYILVNQWLKTPFFPMTNSFSYSNRLKRISMMKKSISNPAKRFFSLAVIPAIIVFFCAFAEKDYIISSSDSQIVTDTNSSLGDTLFLHADEFIYISDTDSEITTSPISSSGDTLLAHSNATAAKGQIGKVFDNGSLSMFNGEFTVRKRSTGLSLEGCEEQPLIIIDDKVTNNGIKDVDIDNIESITSYASEDAIKHFGEKGKQGAIVLTTKTYSIKNLSEYKSSTTGFFLKKENTSKDFGTNIISPEPLDTATYNFETRGKISIIGSEWKSFIYGGKIKLGKKDLEKKPLVIIDGKKEYVDIENIKAETIHSINIYKDNEAIEKYGEEAKNGVVYITTFEGRKALLASSAYDIKGTVVDEFGNPISNANVKITETESYTDQNGMFTLCIVPGDWIMIEAEGYEKNMLQTDEDEKITSAQITLKNR